MYLTNASTNTKAGELDPKVERRFDEEFKDMHSTYWKNQFKSFLARAVREAELQTLHTHGALCPQCNDYLEQLNLNKDGLILGDQMGYHCFGCDQIYTLQAITNHQKGDKK